MGNLQEHGSALQKIKSFQIIKKYQNYTVLKDENNKNYFKFLYISRQNYHDQKQSNCQKSNSIFYSQYLKFRYQKQVIEKKYECLPQIIIFGQDNELQQNLMICSSSKLNFVVFQHHQNTLKYQIEERIQKNDTFKESELLKIISISLRALLQMVQLQSEWNHQNFNFIKGFSLTEDSIFIDHNQNIIISDLLPFINEIGEISKNQKIIKRPESRKQSLEKLFCDRKNQNGREQFFQKGLENLVSIIEAIIFKFQCFSGSNKNSIHEGMSISTALESFRANQTKNNVISSSYSLQLQNLLKSIQKGADEIPKLIEATEELYKISKSKQLVKINASEKIRLLSRKNSQQKGIKITNLLSQTPKFTITSYSDAQKLQHFTLNTKLEGLRQINYINNQANNMLAKGQKPTIKSFSIIKQNNLLNKSNKVEYGRNSSTKIRLSLKKDTKDFCLQNKQNIQQQPAINKQNQLNQKTSNIVITQKIKFQSLPQQSQPQIFCNIKSQSFKRRSQSFSALDIVKQSKKLVRPSQLSNEKNYQKKRVFLKKSIAPRQFQQCIKQPKYNSVQKMKVNIQDPEPQKFHHLNPMSKKRGLGVRLQNMPSKQLYINFQAKGNIKSGNQKQMGDIEIECLDNLSSIISNQNNTLSSYGNPLTEEFKTEHSEIEDEMPIPVNQFNESLKRDNKFAQDALFSHPSLELVESIIERPEDTIPQFLKQFKLPEKHLLALNNIILKQKDMIVEQSFEQSDFNSFRQSIPNILSGTEATQLKKRTSKILDEFNVKIIEEYEQQTERKQNDFWECQEDSVLRGLEKIENSLNKNVGMDEIAEEIIF